MRRSDEFRDDHDALRSKLSLLQEYVSYLPLAHLTLLSLVNSLKQDLQSHARREEQVLGACAAVPRLREEHGHALARLESLRQLLVRREPADEPRIVEETFLLVKELREHVTREEREWFPLMDQGTDEESVQLLGLA